LEIEPKHDNNNGQHIKRLITSPANGGHEVGKSIASEGLKKVIDFCLKHVLV
jgi:hypothetical protein